MATTRKKYPDELKREAIRLVMEGGEAISEVARKLDININTFGGWLRKEKKRRKEEQQQKEEQERPKNIAELLDYIKELNLNEKESEINDKSVLMHEPMDEVISHIRDYILVDTGKTDKGIQQAYDKSNKSLKEHQNEASLKLESLFNIFDRLTNYCTELRTDAIPKDGNQSTDKTFKSKISSWFSKFKTTSDEDKSEDDKLHDCEQDIILRKNSLTESSHNLEVAEKLVNYNLENTPRIDAFLEKSSKYISWGIIPILIPYMSIYLSKLFISRLYGGLVFAVVFILELAVIWCVWKSFRGRYGSNKAILIPLLFLLLVPTVHIIYLSLEVGYFFRTNGLKTLTIIDTSLFVYLLVIISIYSVRRNLLTGFSTKDVRSIRKSELLEDFIMVRFRLLQWRLLFLSVVALFIVSTMASFAVTRDNERVKYEDKWYIPILSSDNRVILIGPENTENSETEDKSGDPTSIGNNESEDKNIGQNNAGNHKNKMKVITILSSKISCSGDKNACEELDKQIPDKPEDVRLSINQAAVGELKVLSARIDDSVNDTDLAYKKLFSCLNKTTNTNTASFRVDFLFCNNVSNEFAVAAFTQDGKSKSYKQEETVELIDDIKSYLKNVDGGGEYHYVGAASVIGETDWNFELGNNRIKFAKEFAKPNLAKGEDWPFGPVSPLKLRDLLPENTISEMIEKNRCVDKNKEPYEPFEQVVQQFAMVAYCPVNTN